jgi:hypothetical protein
VTLKRKILQFASLGLALSIIVGYASYRAGIDPPWWLLWLFAAAIVGVSARWTGLTFVRRPVTPNPEHAPGPDPNVPPRFGSRRWARAQYHSGIISIEELVTFCASHPPVPGDFDNEL